MIIQLCTIKFQVFPQRVHNADRNIVFNRMIYHSSRPLSSATNRFYPPLDCHSNGSLFGCVIPIFVSAFRSRDADRRYRWHLVNLIGWLNLGTVMITSSRTLKPLVPSVSVAILFLVEITINSINTAIHSMAQTYPFTASPASCENARYVRRPQMMETSPYGQRLMDETAANPIDRPLSSMRYHYNL